MSDLRDCPFCGGKAETGCFPLDYPSHNARAYVACKNENCEATVDKTGRVVDARKLLASAVDTWNTRA